MNKYFKKFSIMLLAVICIGIIQNGRVASAATVGQQLTQVEGDLLLRSISLNKYIMQLNVGDSQRLTATTTSAEAQVEWSSDKPGIATIDQNGNVKGISEGNAMITAQIKGSDKKGTCSVSVTKGGTTEPTTGDGNLYIELVDGQIKQYNVSNDEFEKFRQWYINRDNTKLELPYYQFTKGTYQDYIVHDKIDWFELRK